MRALVLRCYSLATEVAAASPKSTFVDPTPLTSSRPLRLRPSTSSGQAQDNYAEGYRLTSGDPLASGKRDFSSPLHFVHGLLGMTLKGKIRDQRFQLVACGGGVNLPNQEDNPPASPTIQRDCIVSVCGRMHCNCRTLGVCPRAPPYTRSQVQRNHQNHRPDALVDFSNYLCSALGLDT